MSYIYINNFSMRSILHYILDLPEKKPEKVIDYTPLTEVIIQK